MSMSDFIDEFYVVTGRFTDRVTSTSLYQKYVKWCKGDSYLSRRAVKRWLVSIGGITHYTSGIVYYTGIREKNAEEITMANNSQVFYGGQVYLDAKRVAESAGSTVEELANRSNNSLIKNVANAKERKADFVDYLTANCVESEFDGYMSNKGALTSFCTQFLLNPDKYICDIKEIIKNGKRIEKPTVVVAQGPTPTGDLLDAILEEQRATNKTLVALLAAFTAIVGSIDKKDEEILEILHKMGPKMGEIDKKLQNINVSTTTVAKSWPGLVTNVAEAKARFDRYTSR